MRTRNGWETETLGIIGSSKQKTTALLCVGMLLWHSASFHALAKHSNPETAKAKAHTCRTIHSSLYLSQFVLSGDDAVAAGALTDTLWGTWLLQTALQHDTELQLMMDRLNHVDSISATLITGSSAVSLAQSITSYSPNATLASNNLGLISITAPFALLGVRAVVMNQLKKRIEAREHQIVTDINQVLQDLETGKPLAEVYAALTPQIGEQSSRQFLKLWWLMENTPLPDFTPPAAELSSPEATEAHPQP